jgi:(p)ppGpp synthase/HD superfamily hydrolase
MKKSKTRVFDAQSQLGLALDIAIKAHAGRKDLCDVPEISHPLTVAMLCNGDKAQAVALLHDTIEDCGVTLDDLRAAGINEEIVAAVDCLTIRPGETPEQYLARVASNETSSEVKFKDMDHNKSRERLNPDFLAPDDIQRRKTKYNYRLGFLLSKIEERKRATQQTDNK